MVRWATRAVLMLGLTCLVAGCGHTRSVTADGTPEIGITEYRLIPDHVQVKAGALAMLVHNYGRLTHNLAISAPAGILAGTAPIPPGHSVWLTVVLPPGSYRMASTLLSDNDLGTYGSLTVTR